MNFTNIYKDPISKYQKYGVPTTRFFNWDEERANNQGTGEKWVNGLTKAGVTTIGAVAENTLGAIAGVGELVTGGAYYDNFIGKTVDKANEAMREAMPNYRTQAEEDMSTGSKLLTANFWADTVANGLGYSIGSLATMYLTGGIGLVGRGARAMQMYNISKNIANGTKIAKGLESGRKMSGITTGIAMGEMGFLMSLAESSVEARETQKNTYESLIGLEIENPDNNINSAADLTPKQLKGIENASYAAGNRNFLTQLPVLMGTNLIMFGKSVAGFKASSKVNKDVAFDSALNKTVSSVANRGKFRNTLSRLKPTASGTVTEAGQEGWQFASNIFSSDYHTDKYFNGGAASLTESLYKGIKETLGTQEGLESMLVGAIVGGGIAGVTSTARGEFKQRKEAAQKAADILNGGFMVNANNQTLNFNAQVKVALDMEKARKSGNHKAFKDAQFKLIQYNAFAALENGTYNVFKQKLEDSKDLSDTDFATMFGYNSEVSLEEQTDNKSKSEVIKNVQDKLDQFKETYTKVNEAFPLPTRSSGLPRMLMAEEKRKAEDAVYNKRANLRAELIMSASGIENRTERLQGIQKGIKDVLQEAERINGIQLDTNIDLLLNPGEELLFDKDGKYDAAQEVDIISKAFQEIQQELVKKNALAAVNPFSNLAQDYMSLFMDNSVAIDRYNKLSSSKYFQDLFEETVKANQGEAQQRAKEEKAKEDIDNAKTSDEVKESVPEDASNNTKMEAERKEKDLKKAEQEEVKKYLNLHKDKSIKEQLKRLQSIANTEQELSPTERKGLGIAIKNLENKLKKGEKGTPARKVEVFDESSAEEITMTEDNIVRADNNDKIAKNAPKKRPVRKKTETADAKRKSEPTPTAGGELNIVASTNKAEVVQVGTYINEDGVEKPIMKVPVDDDGKVIEPNPDKVDGKTIPMVPDLLLANDIIGEEVTFEIVENDWWKSGEFRDERFTEDWMHIPIYYKIGNAYVGKLEGSTNEDRKAIVDKLQGGQIVSTKISDIQTSNFNNTVDETTAPYFHNPEDTFGKEDDILLGFTTVSKVGPNITYQWTLSQVTDDKNKNNELDQINVEVTKEVSANSINQIGIVIKKENNPAGVARISIASTANLNATAQAAVLQALADKNFEKAQEIVSNSDQRLAANSSPRYLEFAAFDNGTKYIVYASPKLGKLIRITEDELKKALDETGPSTFNIVTEVNEAFVGDKSTTEKSKIDIKADLAEFLESKKYHVDRARGNSKGEYVSPVHPQHTYPSYQHYLFASKELGDEVRLEGSGHNSILSTDITKKGESMFNSPQVKFSKGDLLGETPSEIIKNTKIAEISPEAQVEYLKDGPVPTELLNYEANERQMDLFEEAPTQQTSEVKEGVSEVFAENSELSKIGTEQEYSDYLDTIFPDSKVKDVVYHGTQFGKFDSFSKDELGKNTEAPSSLQGFFFSNSIGTAGSYAQRSEKDWGEISLEESIERDEDNKDNNEQYYKLLKESNYDDNRDPFGEGSIFIKSKNKTLYFGEFEKITDEHKTTIEALNKIQNIANKLKEDLNDIQLLNVILNITNPNITDKRGESGNINSIIKKAKNTNDSVILKNYKDPFISDVFVVFEPNQIHILGSKQDVKGFKKFVSKPAQTSEVERVQKESNLLAYHYLKQKQGINNPYGSDTTMITSELGLSFKEAEALVKKRISLIKPKGWKLGDKYNTSELDKQVSDILSEKAPSAKKKKFKRGSKSKGIIDNLGENCK
jgi:hypothetical protein